MISNYLNYTSTSPCTCMRNLLQWTQHEIHQYMIQIYVNKNSSLVFHLFYIFYHHLYIICDDEKCKIFKYVHFKTPLVRLEELRVEARWWGMCAVRWGSNPGERVSRSDREAAWACVSFSLVSGWGSLVVWEGEDARLSVRDVWDGSEVAKIAVSTRT